MRIFMLLLPLVLVSCTKGVITKTIENTDTTASSWTGNYFIGDQTISIVEDEDGKIDISGYVYAKNPNDGSYGEFRIDAVAADIIDSKVRYERTITSAQTDSQLNNVYSDSGDSLDNNTHYLSCTVYFDNDLLTIKLILRNSTFSTIASRTITE